MAEKGVFRCRGLAVDLGGRRILDGIDLELPPGEVTALAGPSGAGKSTLVRALAGLVPLAAGQVWRGGESLLPGGEKRLHRQVQPLFQDPGASLNPRRRVAAIIGLGLGGRRGREAAVQAAMARVGLEQELAHRFPHQLSGGQRQRVAWARALAPGPAVFLLDEPFSALDPPLRSALAARLQELAREGKALLLVTHDLGEVAGLADRLGIMAAGRLVEVGRVARILEAPEHPVTRAMVACHRDPLGVEEG